MESCIKKYEIFIRNREKGRRLKDNTSNAKQERLLRKIKDSSECILLPVVCSHDKELLDVEWRMSIVVVYKIVILSVKQKHIETNEKCRDRTNVYDR